MYNTDSSVTVVPECVKDDNASQWKCGKFRPPFPQKPRNRSSPKFAWVFTLGTLPYPYAKVHHDTISLFCPQIYENAHQVTRLVFWFFCQPTAKTPAPIFMVSTKNNVASRKDVPFGGLENKILYFDPIFLPKRKFWANFRRDKISAQKGLNNGDAYL